MARRALHSLVVVALLLGSCGDGNGSPEVATTETSAPTTTALPQDEGEAPSEPTAAATVVLGDRVIRLESFGCVDALDPATPSLYAFGSDQAGAHYGVRVENYLVVVQAVADSDARATSRFAPAWEGTTVQGEGEFRGTGTLADAGEGSVAATCPDARRDSGWAVDETGFRMPLPAGLVCVDSGSTFSFAAGAEFEGIHTSDAEVVAYLLEELEATDDEPDAGTVVEIVAFSGFGDEGLLRGWETAVLSPGETSPLFTTPLPADRFSITAEIDYVDSLRANPRLGPERVEAVIDRYGDTATFDIDAACTVSLAGPPGATVADVMP